MKLQFHKVSLFFKCLKVSKVSKSRRFYCLVLSFLKVVNLIRSGIGYIKG